MFGRRRIRKHGEQATARVLHCEPRSKITTNELRDYDYDLEVRPAGGEPFAARVRDKFWIAGLRPQEADDVPVRFDPSSKETVFDLEGDPRFDVDAMNARTAELRRETAELQDRRQPPAGA